MEPILCPTCEKATLENRNYVDVVRVGSYHVKMAVGLVPQCPACGEALLELAASVVREQQAALRALHDAEIGPREFPDVRRILGYTQVQLGELLGLTPEQISRIERGESPVQELHARALADVTQGVLAHDSDPERYLEAERVPKPRRSGVERAA